MEEKLKLNGDQPAFACSESGTENFTTWHGQQGLTKREYFAGLFLSGVVYVGMPRPDIAELVATSIKLTDELLRQLGE